MPRCSSGDGTVVPRSSCLCSRITDAHRTGQVMAQFSENRRQASRATSALIFAAALLVPAFMAPQALAQVWSYAPAASSAFPSEDAALALPEDESSVVPERLRRAVVAYTTNEAP